MSMLSCCPPITRDYPEAVEPRALFFFFSSFSLFETGKYPSVLALNLCAIPLSSDDAFSDYPVNSKLFDDPHILHVTAPE